MKGKRSLAGLSAGVLVLLACLVAVSSLPSDVEDGVLRTKTMRARLARFKYDLYDGRRALKPLHGGEDEGEGSEKAWLLEPDVFNALSAGGQRAALRANGLVSDTADSAPRRSALTRTALAGPVEPGDNVRVNDPSQDTGGHTQSETTIIARGGNILVGFNDTANSNFTGYAFSTDGGRTFKHQHLPVPVSGENLGDPVMAFGPAGEVYYATLSFNSLQRSIVGVGKSTDGGATFTTPVEVSTNFSNRSDFQDKEWIAVDTGASSRFKGNVYVSWTDFVSGNGDFIVFARSTDGGATFQQPVLISPRDGTQAVQGSQPAVAPNGDIWVSYIDDHFGGTGISFTRSTDGGVTFSAPKSVSRFNEVVTFTGGNDVRANSFPSTTIDRNGAYHVVYAAIPTGSVFDRSDVYYVSSTDGGSSFSGAVRLNDDIGTTSQWMPSIASAADGTLAAKWWDRRNDPVNDSLTDVYMTLSTDGGAHWGRNVRVTDHNWTFGPVELDLAPSYHGDYDSIAADGGNFYVSWSDERGTDPDAYFSYFTTATASAPDFNVSGRKLFDSVKAGQSVTFDIDTAALNGYSGSLALSTSPAPPGVTLSFSSPSVSAGQPARLTVATTPDAPAGTYLVSVAASGPTLTRRTNVSLTVYDSGRTIPTPSNITRSSGFTGMSGAPAVDASGAIHIVYDDDTANVRGSDVLYRRSTDGGQTYSTPVKISTNEPAAFNSVLALDPSGNPCVVFTGVDDIRTDVYFSRSTDGGTSFSSPVRVSRTNQVADTAGVAVDRNGRILVAYSDSSASDVSLWVSLSTDGGGTFSDPVVVDGSLNPTRAIAVAFDSRGAAYLSYGTASSTIFYARLAVAADGKTFSAPKDISDPVVANAFAPHLVVDANDRILVTFYNRYGSSTDDYNREIMFIRSTDGGATFTPQRNLSNNTSQSTFPFLVADARGGITAAWQDAAADGQPDIFYARSTDGGTSFSSPVNVSANRGSSFGAAAAADRDGNVLLVWTDDSPANTDLFSVALPTGGNTAPTVSLTQPAGAVSVDAASSVHFAGTGSDTNVGDTLQYTWDFGDGTSADGSSVDHVFAVPGTYRVTLTVTDRGGLRATSSVTVTVRVPSPTGPELLLPVVLDVFGASNTHYTTEVTLVSRSSAVSTVLLQYTASNGDGSGFASVTLGPGEVKLIPDAIAFLKAQGLPIPDGSVGTLRAVFSGVAAGDVFIGGRTSTPGAGGAFGLFYPSALTSTTSASVFGLQQNAAQRANLALVNAGPSPVTLRVQLFGGAGEDLGTLPDILLGAWGWTQLNRVLEGKAASGRAVVTRVSGTSPFTIYGVLNDAVTSDGSYIPPVIPGDATGADRLVPIVLNAGGLAHYQSELTLTNLTAASLTLTLVYTAAIGSGTGTAVITLVAGEQRILSDAITSLRGYGIPIPAGGDAGGSLLIRAPSGTPASAFASGARTFTTGAGGGTFGLFYPGLTLGESATTQATINGLQQNAPMRSNLAVVNRGDAGDSITLRLTYHGPDGALLGTPVTVTLAPGEWKQYNQPLGALGAEAGWVKIERLSGNSRWASYGVLNDNANSDGSYLPMSR